MRLNRLCALSLVLVLGTAVEQVHADSPKICVVRPFYILSQMPQYKDLEAKFRAETAQLTADEDRRKKAVADLINERATYKPETPKYEEMSAKIDQAATEFEAWQKMVQRTADREKKQRFRDLWLKIEETTEIVAKDNKVDLVVTDNRQHLPNLEDVNYHDYMTILAERNVIFAGPQIDLSDKILLRIQTDYAAKSKAAGAGAALNGPSPQQQPDHH